MRSRLAVLLIFLCVPPAFSATFDIADGDGSALITAINTANGNNQDDTINLAAHGTYTLTAYNSTPNGLPILSSDNIHKLTINGNGATITTNQSARVFQVADGANVTINLLTISSGRHFPLDGSPAEGGGVLNGGQLTLNNSTIATCEALGNTANNPHVSAQGGGLSNHGFCTLNGCTINGNKAHFPPPTGNGTGDAFGGGIYNTNSLTLINSTIVTNSAVGTDQNNMAISPGGGNGGGLYIVTGGSVHATNCTIASNSATAGMAQNPAPGMPAFGGGVYSPGNGSFIPLNTIIALNMLTGPAGSSGLDVYGTVASSGHNLVGFSDGSNGWSPGNGDRLGGNGSSAIFPQLGALQDNGGPTKTMAIASSASEAINNGDDAAVTAPLNVATDQRGLPRKQGAHVDIGAFEFDAAQAGPALVVTSTGDYNDGFCGVVDCTLREAISVANNTAGANTITFAGGVRGTITLTGGALALAEDVTIIGPGANLLAVDANYISRVLSIVGTAHANISGLTFTRGAISSSVTTAQGGCIYVTGNLTLDSCTISNSYAAGGVNSSATTAGRGGGIFVDLAGNLTISRCTITGNAAYGGSPPSRGSSVAAGAAASGGGIYVDSVQTVYGTLTMQNSTVSGNIAQGGHGNLLFAGPGGNGLGGGIYAYGRATVASSTITANTATGGSGGSFNFSQPGTGRAGGFYIESPNVVQLGGAILAANNSTTDDPDAAGDFTSQGFNLVGNKTGTTGFTAPTDRTGDPKLGPLADNGGPTLTHALLAGSPAIDAANTSLAIDQRGAPRPFDDPGTVNGSGNVSDIGAFEFGAAVPTPTPIPTPTPPTRLGNIATRLRVETGDNILIGGFIVTGSQPKTVVVRGIGPSLSPFFNDYLRDPILELHDSSGQLLETNDNWGDSLNKQAIINSGLAPTNDSESAIIRSLPANNAGYTAVVRGVNNATGIGVVQIYDVDSSVDSKLANISSRGFVQTGDNVLFAGMIVVGQASQQVVVRATGPSLPVDGKMADPTLELHDGNGGLLETNDNWVDSPNKQAIINSGVAPTNDAESAIIRTLAPANYTAIVRGVNNSTGIAVVEVYALN